MLLVYGVLANFQVFMCQTVLIFPNIYTIDKKNRHNLAQKITQEKFVKIFELYQVFVYNFLWQNILMAPYCIPLMRFNSVT